MTRAVLISIFLHAAVLAIVSFVASRLPSAEPPRLEVKSVELSLNEDRDDAPGEMSVPAPDVPPPPEPQDVAPPESKPQFPDEPPVDSRPEVPEALVVPESVALPELPPPSMPEIKKAEERKAPEPRTVKPEVKKCQTPPSPVSQPTAAGGGRNARVKSNPQPSGEIKPEYPRSSRSRGEEGDVILEVKVGRNGRAEAVSVVKSSGYAELDASACKAVLRARFVPAKENGRSVDGSFKLKLSFRLH